MTITIAWLRRKKDTVELVVASDSRLRSHGAIDQAQKIFQLNRGDCCLAFCGDAQIAYPFFIQVTTTLNNFIKTRTRAQDITHISDLIGKLLGNLIDSWDLNSDEKNKYLVGTRILLAGWSWQNNRFDIGYFEHKAEGFRFHHKKAKLPHPWKERERSLVFIGDYENDYMHELQYLLSKRYPPGSGSEGKIKFDFDYEPIEALQLILSKSDNNSERPSIGGAAQMLKVYSYGNSLPFVIRTNSNLHYLFGRKLFDWEKTEYPILDLEREEPVVHFPMRCIPLPSNVVDNTNGTNDQSSEN